MQSEKIKPDGDLRAARDQDGVFEVPLSDAQLDALCDLVMASMDEPPPDTQSVFHEAA